MQGIPFTADDVSKIIDPQIRYCNNMRHDSDSTREGVLVARAYIDAYQNIRHALLGEKLKENDAPI